LTQMILLQRRTDALAAGSVSIAATAICIARTMQKKSRRQQDFTNLTTTSARDVVCVQKNALAIIFK